MAHMTSSVALGSGFGRGWGDAVDGARPRSWSGWLATADVSSSLPWPCPARLPRVRCLGTS